MSSNVNRRLIALVVFGLIVVGMGDVRAQPSAPNVPQSRGGTPAKKTSANAPERVFIRREAVRLIDPESFQVPLQLRPMRTVQLSAPVDGIVSAVLFKPGQSANAQAEAIRLDSREQELLFERAKALHRVAQIEAERAKASSDAGLIELAEAKLVAARANLDLAKLRLERTNVRVPFTAEVFRVQAIEGLFVRAGDPLMSLGDTSQLQVEIPVDRSKVTAGTSIAFSVEAAKATGRIENILPLHKRFEPLRKLLNSIASATVLLDNSNEQWHVGQTVFTELMPRNWVAEIPTSCLRNQDDDDRKSSEDWERKVQVVRREVIREIPVRLLGPAGPERVYVTGPFGKGDEAVLSSSVDLPDGTQIRASTSPGKPRSSRKRGTTRAKDDTEKTKSRPAF